MSTILPPPSAGRSAIAWALVFGGAIELADGSVDGGQFSSARMLFGDSTPACRAFRHNAQRASGSAWCMPWSKCRGGDTAARPGRARGVVQQRRLPDYPDRSSHRTWARTASSRRRQDLTECDVGRADLANVGANSPPGGGVTPGPSLISSNIFALRSPILAGPGFG